MVPPSDSEHRLSKRQTRIWGLALLGLILLGLLASWGLPALLETRLPPNLRQNARSTDSSIQPEEPSSHFVIVEYGNTGADTPEEGTPEEDSGRNDLTGASLPAPDEEPEENSTSPESRPESSERENPAGDTPPLPRLSTRPPNTDPPPMQSLAAQRQLVSPPSLPPRNGSISQSPPQIAPPPVSNSPESVTPRPASEKPAAAGSLRVWAGPFSGREQAQTASEKLSAAGHAHQLITEGGGFRLRLNQTVANPDEALDLADAVALLGFEITVRKAD